MIFEKRRAQDLFLLSRSLITAFVALSICATVATFVGCASSPMQRRNGLKPILKTVETRSPASDSSGNRLLFSWPLRTGQISSNYGRRGAHFHDGIDISAPKGNPVFASGDGVVLYSGKTIKGYGNLIIVKHGYELATVYAHNDKNLVKRGDRVRRGQRIALVGQSGQATAPHLHFEVRYREYSHDPLKYLPAPLVVKRQLASREASRGTNGVQ